MLPFYYIKAGNFSNTAEHRLENVPDAFKQMGNNPVIIAATVGKLPPFVVLMIVKFKENYCKILIKARLFGAWAFIIFFWHGARKYSRCL